MRVCVREKRFHPTLLLLLQLVELVEPRMAPSVWLGVVVVVVVVVVVTIVMVNLHLFWLDLPRDKRIGEDPSLVSVRT